MSLSKFAVILYCSRGYEAVEEKGRRALAGYEKTLVEEHPDMLTGVNLALMLHHLGKSEAAERLHRRVLDRHLTGIRSC